MAMDEGLDTGPMLAIARCTVEPRETSASLFAKLERLGPPALIETLARLAAGTASPQIQDDTLSTYARKIDKIETAIDWAQPAAVIDRKIRAFYPDPIAYATLRGERIKLLDAEPVAGNGPPGRILQANAGGITVACGDGALLIRQLQMPGGKVLSAREVLNGRADWFAVGNDFDNLTGAASGINQ